MAVVIKDFEVLTPNAPEQPAATPAAGTPQGVEHEEMLQRVREELRTCREREERLRAT